MSQISVGTFSNRSNRDRHRLDFGGEVLHTSCQQLQSGAENIAAMTFLGAELRRLQRTAAYSSSEIEAEDLTGS